MSNQNEITTLTFTKESDGWWHSRFTMDTDEVIVQIDSKTEREKYTLVVVYSGTEEYGTNYYNQSFALYGNSSRVFNIKGIEGLNIDIQTNIKPDFGGVMGSVTEVDPPTPPTPPDPPTPPTPGEPDYLCFTANKAGATLRMTGMYTEDYTGDDFALEYSRDGETWQDWNITKNDTGIGMVSAGSDTLTFTSIGDKVYLRGDNVNGTCATSFIFSQSNGYGFTFAGGEGTQPEDNEFSVSGDIQTLKDKTGQDKVAACYAQLFMDISTGYPTILITSAPDLTATTLTPYCYMSMFIYQTLLTEPASMPLITNNMLPYFDAEEETGGSAFMLTYAFCSSISRMIDLSGIVLDAESGDDDVNKVLYNLICIVLDTSFSMTNDNGDTLTFGCGIEFPFTLEDDSFSLFVFCNYLGNYNGFDIAGIVYGCNDEKGTIEFETQGSYFGGHEDARGNCIMHIPTNESVEFSLIATPLDGWTVTKWQSSSDGETWTDIPGATSETYTATLTQTGDYYYKAIFEPLVTIRIDNSQSGQNIVIEDSDTQAAVQDGWVGDRYYKAGEVLSFRPAYVDDGGTTKYLAINGTVGTSYTVTTSETLIITFE